MCARCVGSETHLEQGFKESIRDCTVRDCPMHESPYRVLDPQNPEEGSGGEIKDEP